MMTRTASIVWIMLVLRASSAGAEVSRIDVSSRSLVHGGIAFGSAGPYERITGQVHFTIDPANPRNRVITDLEKARTNARGQVELSADLVILRPRDPSRGNGVALVDVPNRGRKIALASFNQAGASRDLSTSGEFGDGFLLNRGYTIVWVGWEFDVARGPNVLGIDVPVAGGTTGVVRGILTPNERGTEAAFGALAGYAPRAAAATERTLTRRDTRTGPAVVIPPGRWRLEGNVVSLDGGFEPGRIYELAYASADPPIGGLGFAAVRDTASWLKYSTDSPAPVRYAMAFGLSQSGRFLRDFLYLGFNADERDRLVFDAVMAHIAGASRTDLNRRWATPISPGQYSETSFPFADVALRDPVTGVTEGALDNRRARDHQPKIFYTNSSVEYWGGARSAALIHTTPDGSADLELPDHERAYLLSGTQHGPSGFPPEVTNGKEPNNPNNYWWTMRALLVAMGRWVADGVEPPPSRHPRLRDGTLVSAGAVAFPELPSVAPPRAVAAGSRAANPWLESEGAPGAPLPLLVPEVDADGNERAGVRLPDVAVPLATYTGWNFRNPRIGAPEELFPLAGSYLPFAATRAERERAGDPRPSIEERYASRERYLARVEEAATALAKDGYVLADDVPLMVGRAGEHWDWRARRTGAGR